jgi:prophage DNA circulation protein
MKQINFKNTQDVDTLKQKLVIYKQTLEALKGENVVEDYLLTKDECFQLKKQVSTLEGEIQTMKEKQDLQMSEYQEKMKNISVQVESVNDSIRLLKQDVAFLMNKVNSPNFNDLIHKIDKMIDIQNASISLIKEGNSEMKGLKEEITQSKEHGKNDKQLTDTVSPKIQKHQPLSYKQLQNILQSSRNSLSYSDQEKRAIPRWQDHAQKLQQSKQSFQQAIPTKGRQVKQSTTHSKFSPKHEDFNKVNLSKNKTKKISKEPSISINEQSNNKWKPKD